MKNLSEYTKKELQDELERRVEQEEREGLANWGIIPHKLGFSGKDIEIHIFQDRHCKPNWNY